MSRLRLVLLLGLLALSLGPAPGEVGGCGAEVEEADAEAFCLAQTAWDCRRQEARGEIGAEEVQGCVDQSVVDCEGTNWPFTCQPFPTDRQAQACIDQLSLASNVDRAIADIPECQLCGGGS